MAHSHSSHNNNNNHHQHRMPKPANLGLSQQNFENLMMGSSRFQNVVPSSSSAAQQQVDHSWQTERTLNLDDFDDKDFNLVNYIAADSTTPLEDMGPGLNMDEIDRQKTEATWMQGNYEQIFSEQHQQEFHHQEHDFVPSNDFASVPNYDEADPEMEMAYQEEIPPSITPIAHQAFISQRAHRNLDKITLTPSTSRASTVHQTLNRMAVKPEIIKEEPSEHQEESFVGLSLTGGGSTSSRASSVTSNPLYTTAISGGIKMSTKPRKYRIKPESEKMNPQYRMKRTKNNDAVRKSREKAKKHQEAKDLRLQQLEEDVVNQSQIIAEQDTQIAQLRSEIGRLKQNCRCGAATGKHRR